MVAFEGYVRNAHVEPVVKLWRKIIRIDVIDELIWPLHSKIDFKNFNQVDKN